mgnify:CR=1 FL=1
MSVFFITNNDNDINDVDIDDIEYGINKEDMSVKYDNNTKIELKETELINPFYVGIKGGNLKDLSWGDIYRNYNSVIVLTNLTNLTNLIDKDNTNQKIFDKIIQKDDLQKIKNITYFRVNLNIIKNKDHFF